MSSKQRYELTWTCDRCGATVTVKGTHRPNGWSTWTVPPNVGDYSDLCPDCWKALIEWSAGISEAKAS